MGEQGVHPLILVGVDHHPRALVHQHDVLVLIEDVQLGLVEGVAQSFCLVVDSAADRAPHEAVGELSGNLSQCDSAGYFEVILDILAIYFYCWHKFQFFWVVLAAATSRSISCEGRAAWRVSSIFERA